MHLPFTQRSRVKVRLSDIRRMDEVFGEFKRERQARVEEYREVRCVIRPCSNFAGER